GGGGAETAPPGKKTKAGGTPLQKVKAAVLSYGVQRTAASTLLKEIKDATDGTEPGKVRSKWYPFNNEHAYGALEKAITQLEGVIYDRNKPHYAQFIAENVQELRSAAAKARKANLLDEQFVEFTTVIGPHIDELTMQMRLLLDQCSQRLKTESYFDSKRAS
ncbi:unnamed protein product, partial [Prorocentrum cordatum]